MGKFKFRNIFTIRKIKPITSRRKFDPKNVDRLKMGLIMVRKGHGVAVNNLLFEHGVAMSTLFFAEGAREKYVADILGGESQQTEVILTIINERKINEVKKALKERFLISKDSRGIMFIFDVKSMAGVLAYKYLADFGGAAKYGKK